MSYPRRSFLFLGLMTWALSACGGTPFVERNSLLSPQITKKTTAVFSEQSTQAPVSAQLPENLEYLDRVVAIVNGSIITSIQLDHQVAAIRARLQQQEPGQMPPDSALRRQVLQQMILQDIEIQLAQRAGIKASSAALNQAVANIAHANNLTPGQLREALVSQGQSWKHFKKDLRNHILVDRLMQQEVESRIHLDPGEIKTFSRQLKTIGGVSFNLQQIFVALPPTPTPEALSSARAAVDQIRNRLVAGASFSRLATETGGSQDALQGGHLGWVKAAQLTRTISQTLLTLKPGQISPIIPSADGFHIFKVLDVRHEQPMVTEVKAAMILLHAAGGLQLQEAETRASEIESSLGNGTPFPELARSYSQDPHTAAKGGELGWVQPGRLPDILERTLLGLHAGAISSPVRTGNAIYILQSQGQRQVPVNDAQILAVARIQLFNRIAHQRMQEWQRRIRDSAYVEILDPALRTRNA